MEIHLTKVLMDRRSSASRAALGDVHACHRAIMRAYPQGLEGGARSRLRVLWREESAIPPVLLVQSSVAPDAAVLGEALGASRVDVKRIDERLRDAVRPGSEFAFRLVANVTRKIDTRSLADGARRHGRRVPLRRDDDRYRWLDRRIAMAGAAVVRVGGIPDVQIRGPVHRTGRRGGIPITFEGLDFRGRLVVEDAERFLRSLAEGIGPAKAYGFGLLSIAPPRT